MLKNAGPDMLSFPPCERPRVSILIPTQDQLGHLAACLASLERTIDPERTPYEVVIAFNGTDSGATGTFLKSVSGIRAIPLALNLGFGGGNNYAANRARGEFLVFLNDDAEVEPGWLDALLGMADSSGDIGGVASRILFLDGSLQEAGGIIWSDGSTRPLGRLAPPGSLAFSFVRPVDYGSANGLLVRRDAFLALGGFDPRFFPAYYEDVDLCLGIRHRLGKEIVYEPRAVIRHAEAASTPDSGFRSFLFRRNQRQLCEKWGFVLAAYAPPEPESPLAVAQAVQRRRRNPIRVLVIDDRVPDAGLGSGFGRTVQLCADLNDKRFATTLYPSDRSHPPRANTVAGLGVDIIESDLTDHLSHPENAYDAVVISRPHNADIFLGQLRKAFPNVPVIYDAEALYHKRLWTQAKLETDPQRRDAHVSEAQAMERCETGIASSVDRLVAISPDERDWLQEIAGHAPVDLMVPFDESVRMSPAALADRADAVFVAGWLAGDGSPNVDALRWYCRYVVPLVRKAIPAFRTLVTGKDPPVQLRHDVDDLVVFTGFVRSIADVYGAARIAIAPIRVGAGVKIKTMEALQYGVPVVATPIGAEGLGLNDGVEIDVTDDPEEYARRIVTLMTDAGAWTTRRRAIEGRVSAWERDRVRWSDVVLRALAKGGRRERQAQDTPA